MNVPLPVQQPWMDGFVFRYRERTIHQAIVQKLARMISGLHAIDALLTRGLFQEQGVIQRAVDEIGEDVLFLSLAIINNDMTARHEEYLRYFYAEEFEDPFDIVGSHASRGMVKRDKIRAYINQAFGVDSARANTVGRFLTKAYSGFVHAASPHIMDMCAGNPARFDINGASAPFRTEEHADDALNYFYRSLVAMCYAAKAFGDEDLFSEIYKATTSLEAKMQ
jgi:hypothetical protein